jgi:predicted ATPase
LLLNRESNQTTAITTALRGAGGFGKTTLASALCHDPDIQAAFPDGILWVELGEHPPRPLDVLNGRLQALEPSLSGALTLEEARDRWQKALEKRASLLVIDDVWQTEALEELLEGGPRCGRLVTTRNDQILREETKRVWVDAMEPEEAIALLCQGLVEDWHHTLEQPVLERVVVRS